MTFNWEDEVRGCRQVLDVGANVGDMTQRFLGFGAEHVLALEPIPEVFAQLAARFIDDPRVFAMQLGVSDELGLLRGVNVHNCWTLLPEAGAKLDRAIEFIHKLPFEISLTTIDRLLEGTPSFHPDFIKIDVDGYDAKAMRGATKYLAKHKPLVLLEVSYLPHFLDDCCECMVRDIFKHGYTMTSIVTGQEFKNSRDFMRVFPWDTSFDVLLRPQ